MSDRDNLKDRAYEYLMDAIVSGELRDGEQTSVYQLAEQLGMSRTPVREAVLQLAETGLVNVERNRGIRIRGITSQTLRDIFELRLLLESPASSFAAAHSTPELNAALTEVNAGMSEALAEGDVRSYLLYDREFHEQIAASSGNLQLVAALDSLRDVVREPGSGVTYGGREPQQVIDEHIAIAAAIEANDPQEAATAMREHLIRTGTILIRQISERTGEVVPSDWAERLTVPLPR